MALSALISGVMATGGALLSGAQNGAMTRGALVVAVITGVMACCKDLQAYLSTPPKDAL